MLCIVQGEYIVYILFRPYFAHQEYYQQVQLVAIVSFSPVETYVLNTMISPILRVNIPIQNNKACEQIAPNHKFKKIIKAKLYLLGSSPK